MCDEWLEDKYAFYDWVNDGNFYIIDGEPTWERSDSNTLSHKTTDLQSAPTLQLRRSPLI